FSPQGTSSQTVTEYVVRVPRNNLKRYNIMAFNAADKVNFSTWHQAKMERDLSNKKIYQEEEMPESGAGSEFNRKLRDEARRKKWHPSDRDKASPGPQSQWKTGGGERNTSTFTFLGPQAFPVHNWDCPSWRPCMMHSLVCRRNKVLNHFSIMQQRRLKDQDHNEDEDEHKEKKNRKKPSELRIHDLEDDLEMSSDDSNSSGEEGEKVPKSKKKAAPSRGGKKKKKKGSDDEAFEDSDDGDFEGQEVDYMSDGSSSGSLDQESVLASPSGIDEESESSEESEEEKPPEEEEKEEEDKKAPNPQEKKKRKDSSEESDTSEESDIDNEASSALFMTKKKTPPKREQKASGNSSRGNSRPSTPSVDSGSTSSTLRAAASKLEQGKRQTGPSDTPAAKRLRLDAGPQSISGKSTPQPHDVQVTEDAVRRYLTRKPMTTKDLLKKFQTKKTGLSSDQTVNVLAQILKRLNPERKMINDKMHFSLKE
uniref:Transcription initiation factor IIF subunit alpha n=1 Tax=Sarcophilus harrisii TaxID=9305 RepID=A0A7N4V300_SARHA